jgi:hypothetical protein
MQVAEPHRTWQMDAINDRAKIQVKVPNPPHRTRSCTNNSQSHVAPFCLSKQQYHINNTAIRAQHSSCGGAVPSSALQLHSSRYASCLSNTLTWNIWGGRGFIIFPAADLRTVQRLRTRITCRRVSHGQAFKQFIKHV